MHVSNLLLSTFVTLLYCPILHFYSPYLSCPRNSVMLTGRNILVNSQPKAHQPHRMAPKFIFCLSPKYLCQCLGNLGAQVIKWSVCIKLTSLNFFFPLWILAVVIFMLCVYSSIDKFMLSRWIGLQFPGLQNSWAPCSASPTNLEISILERSNTWMASAWERETAKLWILLLLTVLELSPRFCASEKKQGAQFPTTVGRNPPFNYCYCAVMNCENNLEEEEVHVQINTLIKCNVVIPLR